MPSMEWEVLWHILFNLPPDQLPAFISSLDIDLFSDRIVKSVVARCQKLFKNSSTITTSDVMAFMREDVDNGSLSVKDVYAMAESYGSVVRLLGVNVILAQLAQYAVRRKAVMAVQDLFKGFENGKTLAEQKAEKGIDPFYMMTNERDRNIYRMATGKGITEKVDSRQQLIDGMRNLQNPDRKIDSGIDPWDRQVGGLFPGEYYIIHGPSGVTKTGLMVNMAYNAAKQDKRAVYFTLEENVDRIHWRLWSRETGIPMSTIKKRDLNDKDWGAIHDASLRLSELPLEVVDAQGWTPQQIREYCEKNGPYAVVCIDSFAFVNWGIPNIYERAKFAGEWHKALAHDLDLALITICHNSTQGSREDMPTKFNVEGGEGLTRPAWVCVELRLDEEQPNTPGIAYVKGFLTKNRDGPPKQYMPLQWDALCCTYSERTVMRVVSDDEARPNMGVRPNTTRVQNGPDRAR